MSLSAEELEAIRHKYPELREWRSDDLDEPIDPLTFVDPTGDSLLHIAARAGDLRTVELLVRAGVDVNQVGDMGCTALHYATMKKKDDVYSYLVTRGASTSIRNEFGLLPSEVVE
jgi:ankyrin repeat protein